MSTASHQVRWPVATRAMGLFLLVAACTAAWLGLNVALPGLQATGIPSVAIRLIIHTAMLMGLWLALAQTDFPSRTRVSVWLAIAVPFPALLALLLCPPLH